MSKRIYSPVGNERKAIVSGGVATCILTLILTVTAAVMVVTYLNNSADRAFAATLSQYGQGGQDQPPTRGPNGGALGGSPQGDVPGVSTPPSAQPSEPSSPSPGDTGEPSTAEPPSTAPTAPPADPTPSESTGPATTTPSVTEPPVTAEPSEPSATEEPSTGTSVQRPDKLGRRDEPVVRKRPNDPASNDTTAPEPPDTDASGSGEDGALDEAPTGTPDGTAADGNAGGDGHVEQPPAANGEGSVVTYVVKPGDTLGKIAKRFGVSVDDIATRNGIVDTSVISVGQVLYIPGGTQGQVSPNTGPED